MPQFRQDRIVWDLWLKYLGASGTFVDVGASDGVTSSNTLFFEKLGWTGLCVEPRPDAFEKLVNSRPGSICEGCAIHAEPSGYDSELNDRRDSRSHKMLVPRKMSLDNRVQKQIPVKGELLQTLLDRHSIVKINYLSVGVKNSEMDVVLSIDFDRVSIDVMTIKNNHNTTDIRDLLGHHGYIHAGKIEIDDVFVHPAMHRSGACIRLNWPSPLMRGQVRPICIVSPEKFDCFVGGIYVVNLKHRTDRWEHISGVLDALNIDYVRWEASYGKDVSTTPHEVRSISKLGAVGCRDSHIRIAKDAVSKGLKSYLVFEDDAVFTGERHRDFFTACALWKCVQPPDWDLFYLGGNKLRSESFLQGVELAADIFCTHAYMASDRMAKKIIQNAADSGIPIDGFFRSVQNRDCLSYTVKRSLFGQIDDYSDIEQMTTTGRLYGAQQT